VQPEFTDPPDLFDPPFACIGAPPVVVAAATLLPCGPAPNNNNSSHWDANSTLSPQVSNSDVNSSPQDVAFGGETCTTNNNNSPASTAPQVPTTTSTSTTGAAATAP
jgi:hypothetical protein